MTISLARQKKLAQHYVRGSILAAAAKATGVGVTTVKKHFLRFRKLGMTRGHKRRLLDLPLPAYTGPDWIGTAIGEAPLPTGDGWIGQRITVVTTP